MDDCIRQGQQIAIAANAIAVAIAGKLTLEEQNIIGNLLALAGASLLSVAAIGQACQTAKEAASGTQSSGSDTQNSSSDLQSSNSQSSDSENKSSGTKSAADSDYTINDIY